MPKLVATKVVKFFGFADLDDNPVNDWHREYLGTVGLLCIYASNSKPGKHFIYYYPNEPENSQQRWFNSTIGDLDEVDNVISLRSGHSYKFLVGEFLSEEDETLIKLNVFCR